MNALIRLLTEADGPWVPGWQPDRQMVAWFANMLRTLNDGAVWGVPGTGQVYQISHANKTLTLIHGDPKDPRHWHDKNKITLAKLGYKVLDRPESPPNPDEQAFSEAIVDVFLDEDVAFDKQKATLQYRPYQIQDGWKWYWVLLPEDGSSALATGTGDSRSDAGIKARKEARKKGIVIHKIDLLKPFQAKG